MRITHENSGLADNNQECCGNVPLARECMRFTQTGKQHKLIYQHYGKMICRSRNMKLHVPISVYQFWLSSHRLILIRRKFGSTCCENSRPQIFQQKNMVTHDEKEEQVAKIGAILDELNNSWQTFPVGDGQYYDCYKKLNYTLWVVPGEKYLLKLLANGETRRVFFFKDEGSLETEDNNKDRPWVAKRVLRYVNFFIFIKIVCFA